LIITGKEKTPFLIAVSFIVLILLIISRPSQNQPNFKGDNSLFRGYQSKPVRIEPIDIFEILSKGNTSNITVKPENRIIDDEYAEWSSFLEKGRFSLEYTYGANYTHYSYRYGDNETGSLNQFWDKLKWYLHLSEEEIQREKDRFYERGKAGDRRVGSKIDGVKPDWTCVISDLGVISEVDSDRVGHEYTYFDSGAELRLNTFCVVVEQNVQIDDMSVDVRVEIDSDSDIRLELDCDEQVDNPSSFFIELFDYMGLSDNLLESIIIDEKWVAWA